MAKILIVDDQLHVRELVGEELISDGYRVAATGNAESVAGCLRFSCPDLVLLDLYLDGPDGFRVLDEIKREKPCLPVIIFTAYDSYVDDPRLSLADGYVIKNSNLDELKQNVAHLLKQALARETAEQALYRIDASNIMPI
jgi:DNA-binding NtrC family response regulator